MTTGKHRLHSIIDYIKSRKQCPPGRLLKKRWRMKRLP